jgi:hypothetical protein
MPQITRLVNNRFGWEKPSGIDCKCLNIGAPLFEVKCGFGFEEWLFNNTHNSILEEQSYYFGYLEAFNNNAINIINQNRIYLFNEMYPNQFGTCDQATKRIVGYLQGVEVISDQEYNHMEDTFFEWKVIMREELNQALINDNRLAFALNKFDEHWRNRRLFNVKYISAGRFTLPDQNTNWNYLNVNHGIQLQLRNKFILSNIDNEMINEYVNLNGGNIPQILAPL